MSDALVALVDLLNLEAIELDIFRGVASGEYRQRTFGGHIAAQALMAAGRTVERGRVHSLHSYFLRAGDSMTPTLYEVDRIRDGKSFSTRRVVAIQHGKAIYNMQASFHSDEEAFEHQIDMPEVPSPESILPTADRIRAEGRDDYGFLTRPHPIDHRYVGPLPWSPERTTDPVSNIWIKSDGVLPDDPLLHACVVTYASDMTLFDTMMKPQKVRWDDPTFMGASLDHCMWFHRDVRADEWLLYAQESPITHAGRGLARGFLFSCDGLLRVSMVQEGLTRRLQPQAKE